jgi:hypothetical protein
LLENEVIDLYLGEEKNIFQNEDLGDEIEENDEMYIF